MKRQYNIASKTSSKYLIPNCKNSLFMILFQQIELENTLEQEQEALVNKLWKRMDKLEAEKR